VANAAGPNAVTGRLTLATGMFAAAPGIPSSGAGWKKRCSRVRSPCRA
jgi:hypothetical protein